MEEIASTHMILIIGQNKIIQKKYSMAKILAWEFRLVRCRNFYDKSVYVKMISVAAFHVARQK